MIELMFTFGTEYVLVVIKGHQVTFGNTSYGAQMAAIDRLKLDKAGVIKEFPDLEGHEHWRQEAIKRFKDKIMLLDSEEAIANYIIEDLKKHGYKPYYKQIAGHRKVRIK